MKRLRLTKEAVEEELDYINEQIASDYNEPEDGYEDELDDLEYEANGYYVNKEKRVVEFEFTIMNDKTWSDRTFESIKEDYGLDLDLYLDYFEF